MPPLPGGRCVALQRTRLVAMSHQLLPRGEGPLLLGRGWSATRALSRGPAGPDLEPLRGLVEDRVWRASCPLPAGALWAPPAASAPGDGAAAQVSTAGRGAEQPTDVPHVALGNRRHARSEFQKTFVSPSSVDGDTMSARVVAGLVGSWAHAEVSDPRLPRIRGLSQGVAASWGQEPRAVRGNRCRPPLRTPRTEQVS